MLARPGERPSDWESARDRAALLRLERLTPSVTRRRVDRWLAPVLVVLWVVSMSAHLLARVDAPAHQTLEFTGSGAALALMICGFLWLFMSGRLTFAGNTESPSTLLSRTDRRRIRRQLARKAPLDLEHADVILELAHRQRRLTLGSLAVAAIELPNSIGIALGDPDPITVTLSSLSLLVFLALGLYCLITYRRLAPLIRRLEQLVKDLPFDDA